MKVVHQEQTRSFFSYKISCWSLGSAMREVSSAYPKLYAFAVSYHFQQQYQDLSYKKLLSPVLQLKYYKISQLQCNLWLKLYKYRVNIYHTREILHKGGVTRELHLETPKDRATFVFALDVETRGTIGRDTRTDRCPGISSSSSILV